MTQNYAIPLTGGSAIIVHGEFPITEDDWVQFLAVLDAMKPGLVKSSSPGHLPASVEAALPPDADVKQAGAGG